MGKLKDFSSFPNLSTLLLDEGFSDVHLSYLGGMWVMLEFETEDIKKNLMVHTGINSWFDVIQDAETDFVSDERIVWVDIEGVPLKAWSRETFTRIAKKWGEMLELEDNADNSFGRKRICIKTKNPVSILESFKIIVKGKIFMVRAKELFTWNPSFVVSKERVYNSEDESVHDASHPNEAASDNGSASDDDDGVGYYLWNKLKLRDLVRKTPYANGGSVLGVLDDIIKLGQSMGYTMEGCAKDLENIIDEKRNVSNRKLAVKVQLNFLAFKRRSASGGILCMWEASMFKKDNATISDNFVALYGTWLPTNSKIMFVVVYAPQQAACKMVLWDYLSILLNRWVGDTIMMGDFNEVRSIDERRGSIFNPNSARRFDQFISSSGLVDVKLDRYTLLLI
ncbi:RNA-directed DNA polymerase, eukaryota [Tanacetum coccineum]